MQSIPFFSLSIHRYPGGGLNLSNVLAPPDKEKPLISRELILEGIQKMPKPNPAWMFHKEAYDMSALHLTEQAIGMRHRSAEVDRQIQQLLQDAENQGLTAAGAHPILKDLLQTQRDLLRDQQRIKEEVPCPTNDGIPSLLLSLSSVSRTRISNGIGK